MPYLADTNLLLRGVQANDPTHATARSAIATLLAQGETVYLVPQNLVEFWVVATRPEERNGLGMTAAEAETELERLEGQFPVLPETAEVYAAWRRLVTNHGVIGVRSYDARLVASMLVHQVTHVLTFNGGDFRRFPGVAVVHPQDVAQPAPPAS